VPNSDLSIWHDTLCQGDNYDNHGFVANNLQADVDTSIRYGNIYNCDSIIEIHIKVHPTYHFVFYDTICKNAVYDNHGFYIEDVENSTVLTFEGQSVNGCDSTVILNLFMVAQIEKYFVDSICEYDFYNFYGENLNETGSYVKHLPGPICDTIAYLDLTVFPGAKVWENVIICETNLPYYYRDTAIMDAGTYVFQNGCDITTFILEVKSFSDFKVMVETPICADERLIPIALIPTTTHVDVCATNYMIEFNGAARGAGFDDIFGSFENEVLLSLPEDFYPGSYAFTITLFDSIYGCARQVENINFDVLYPSNVMKQKWNNTIALYNHLYNGGYDFIGYQWYHNGELLAGETSSYLYTGDNPLILGDEYSVELLRKDNTKCLTCPMVATAPQEEAGDFPVVMQEGPIVKIHNANDIEAVRVFSYTGQLLYSMTKFDHESTICELPVPHATGFVILELKYKNGNIKHADIVIK
jgi:hypothetical protein